MRFKGKLQRPYLPFYILDRSFNESIRLRAPDWRGLVDSSAWIASCQGLFLHTYPAFLVQRLVNIVLVKLLNLGCGRSSVRDIVQAFGLTCIPRPPPPGQSLLGKREFVGLDTPQIHPSWAPRLPESSLSPFPSRQVPWPKGSRGRS